MRLHVNTELRRYQYCAAFVNVSIPHAAMGSYQTKLRSMKLNTVIYAMFGIFVFLWPKEVAKCVDGSSVKMHKLIACVS